MDYESMTAAKTSKRRSRSLRVSGKRVTFDTVRQIAQTLPGAEESTSYGTPAFKVKGKLFARQYQDVRGFRRSILKLHPPAERIRKMGLVPANGRHGPKTWRTWLSENAAAATSSPVHATDSR